MRIIIRALVLLHILSSLMTIYSCKTISTAATDSTWETLTTYGQPTARHEAGLIALDDKIYLLGGRRVNPTSVYDTKSNTWTEKASTPVELHHFQPIAMNGKIYIIGAMMGKWPREQPHGRVIVYDPNTDEYEYTHTIPEARRRGGAGLVTYNDKIYIVGGITNGHMNGYKPWLDEYDPLTGKWKILDDAPNARDHFQAVVIGDKLYAFGGRNTSKITEQDMALTNKHGNVYDFKSNKWQPVTNDLAIPTMRAGNFAIAWNNSVIVGGGESEAHVVAHNEVEAYNTTSKSWSKWPSLNQGRHGTGFANVGDYLYTASGCGNRGGEPELTSIERIKLPEGDYGTPMTIGSDVPVYSRYHTVSLSFEGPSTSETDTYNPFLNYWLSVEFTHNKSNKSIRGFYAADGNAGETSANSGSIWKVRFTPEELGEWSYKATLQKGDNIALSDDPVIGESVDISNATGKFIVVRSDKEGDDLRAHGRLEAADGYFRFKDTGEYWLKVGANSPENLLGYTDFDGTYRIQAQVREGEAATTEELHFFEPHLGDWNNGDPTWQGGKGKSIIGAVNYLASKGMNSIYFLAMNIMGDGKDVWPYESQNDFTRFDVSKLDQWEILFQHMQSKGILLHVVLQETENELLLDNGDTGPQRQLYFREMIARFGHHLALVWNLGEENGPAPWSPDGQNDQQRKDMAKFIKESDPYNNTVLLHTHSEGSHRNEILEAVVGYEYLDGLSLQQAVREEAGEIMEHWKNQASESGKEWLISMDEIGMWHTATLTDSLDSGHKTLRSDVQWGTLLSGGAGVEWYFGGRYPHNDLNSEDWRQRDQLWEITNHAKVFFDSYLPYWMMHPDHGLINSEKAYCLREESNLFAIYLPDSEEYTIDLSDVTGSFTVQWYDPVNGGNLQNGSVSTITGGSKKSLGSSPRNGEDWVVLLNRSED